MKRLIGILICAFLFIGLQTFINCSSPLESDDIGKPSPPPPGGVDTVFLTDTLYIFDTVFTDDSVMIIDTVVVIDTLFDFDTLFIVDTVIVVEPDTVDNIVICTQMNPKQKKIFWIFENLNGQYRMKFSGEPSKDSPPKTLRIQIGAQEFEWSLSDGSEFVVDIALQGSTTVTVEPRPPLSHGNHLDICLDISAL